MTAEEKEAKELADALEQVRQFEEKEQAAKEKVEESAKVATYVTRGSDVYELFSVLVHQGGAYGGHYYAFIKSFEDGKWYKYNDADVKECSEEDMKTAFGGDFSTACAYMLMYRRFKPDTPPEPVPDQMIPEYIRNEIEAERIKVLEEQKA